ncbi:MAG TPA: metallophosphoesterase, partial [Bacillota bacterium]|nr:metallophosphoesterase [Bacillota bacterium]
MPLKVLHTGDLHLGMTFNSRGYPEALRRRLVEARLKVLERLVETANGEGCQLFIVAGDLFHRTRV